MMKKYFAAVLCLFAIASCSKKEAPEELVFPLSDTQQIILQKKTFADLKNWENDNADDLIKGFALSCEKIMKIKEENLPIAAVKISTADYQKACINFFEAKISDGKQFKKFLKSDFVPYLVTENGDAEGRFTSYYQAGIKASETRDETYKYPIYGKPDNLVVLNLQDFGENLPSMRLTGRVDNQRFVPYYKRAEIENNANITKDFPILLWADSDIDVFFMQMQGSAMAVLPDGRTRLLDYAANNGRVFQGIGGLLLADKRLEAGKASVADVKAWLEKNPDEAKKYMQKNDRYVFHRFSDKEGVVGAQGVILTPQRSLAVDKTKVPLGSLLWLETLGPDREPIEKIVIAQDTGEAIKGVVRGDYFWGYGEGALESSGKMSSRGRYFILMPKTDD